MKRSTWIAIWGATVLLAILLVMWRVAATPTLPEEQVVRDRIEEIRQAIEERKLNALMDSISSDFNAFGYSRDRLRIEIASAFRRGIQPSLRYTPPVINIIGKEATVNTRVEVWWEEQGLVSRHEPTDIQIRMRKEPARKWLVFPTEKWRVVEVEGMSVDGLE
ncbi:MAG: hypothetical protein RMM06_02180 [Armatimonadota bacterium]|nr:hypothetical protein [Armatimonadota bacterium]MDW8104712.1 hypothetical protein [Armatimonadota bacterium]MDW8289504.1 hypothetical protein [Armatimonadota bacterium]